MTIPARMLFTVCDDGPGFDTRAAERDRRDRVSQHENVTGFGLVAVRHLVEARGGRIAIDRDASGLGGARVSFSFPACRIGQVLAFPNGRDVASTFH